MFNGFGTVPYVSQCWNSTVLQRIQISHSYSESYTLDSKFTEPKLKNNELLWKII